MSAIEIEGSNVPGQLVEQLARGYDALSVEIKSLDEQRRELENKLSWAKQQYLEALKRFSPVSASKDFHTFLSELEEAAACQQERGMDWLESLVASNDGDKRTRAYNIQRAGDARDKIRHREKTNEAGIEVTIWKGQFQELGNGETIEQDFTTAGTPGRLGCPFASDRLGSSGTANGPRGTSTPRSSMSRGSRVGRRSKRPSFHDPIRAEVCAMSSQPSVEGSVPLCPIRFLDQHSPEEVATYFEKHKHEIPRSHEFCVKRFQQNEETLRSLDSKYANMISMVKELGKVHQPMLPNADDVAVEDDGEIIHNPTAKVESWAKAVSATAEDSEDIAPANEDEERESRFDRPLKDIRLGESPSRPWGIPIPEKYTSNGDAASQKSDPTASPLEPTLRDSVSPELPGKRCPFSSLLSKEAEVPLNPHLENIKDPGPEPAIHQPIPAPQSTQMPAVIAAQQPVPQMVFNGPVFIGYPLDQAMAMLKLSGFSPEKTV